jgi:hypothetical protein
MPRYDAGHICFLAGADGPPSTDSRAPRAAADPTRQVTCPGMFRLRNGEVLSGTCHANPAGQPALAF